MADQTFHARLADAADPDDLAAWLVSALESVSTDDAGAAALLTALAGALQTGGPPAALLDAAAFDWGPPALRAGDAGPKAAAAASALANALATSLSPKEAVALLNGEVASTSDSASPWAPHQAAALGALPVALARASGLTPAQRTRMLRSALDAATAGLGPALRGAVVAGEGGGEVAASAATAWWGALPALAAGDAAARSAAGASVAAGLGRALLGVPLPLSPAARSALPRPAAAGVEAASAEAARLLGCCGSSGPGETAAQARRAAALAGAGVRTLRGLGFNPAQAGACPFIPATDGPAAPSSLDSDEEADAAAAAEAAAVGWAIAVAAILCVDGCGDVGGDGGVAGDQPSYLVRAAACVPALLAAASAARAPGAVALAAAASAVAAARSPHTPSSPTTALLLDHLTPAMAGVPSAPARNAAFHAWDGVLGCLVPGDRLAAAVAAADAAAEAGSSGVEALALHHLSGMVTTGGGGGGKGGAACTALLAACTARLTPGPPPLAWADDLGLAHRAEPVGAALAGLRLLLLLGQRGDGGGVSKADAATLRSSALLPLQAAAGRGAAALRALEEAQGNGVDASHAGALALERVREGVARVLELVEG